MQFVKPKPFKEAVEKLGAKSVIGSNLKSSEWLEVQAGLRDRAFFSATIESVRFLQGAKDFIGDFLEGNRDPETGALKAGGRAQFVKEMREFAIAEGLGPLTDDDKGTIKDITSEKRLSLIFNVQTQSAHDYGYWKQGMDPDLINEFPAQRFIREADVKIERPLHVQNEGVVRLKTDLDFWLAMNSPLLGGFGVPWGPWGFNSGMGVEDVDRDEAESLGLIKPGQKIQPVDKDFNDRLASSVRNLDPLLQKKLKNQFGEQVVIKDGVAYWKGNKKSKDLAIPPVPKAAVEKPEIEPGGFPKKLSDLEEVKSLGGSTGAMLMRDKKTGEQFVLKRGNSAEHLREEFLADELYRTLGIAVPEAKLYEDAKGPVKLAKFIEGQTLKTFFNKSGPGAQRAVLERIRKGFVADALMGNWDVAGLDLDNILVDKEGTPWRIDNGGSLRFRAQGAKKAAVDFGPHVEELKTLLDAKLNPSTARVFANLTDTELGEQLTKLIANREKFLAAVPAELKDLMRQRVDSIITQISPGTFGPEFTEAVKKARLSGVTHLGDRDLIEDTTVLFWQEKDTKGNPVTRAKLRLTQKGSDAIIKTLQDDLNKLKPLSTTTMKRTVPGDAWALLEPVIKHVNHHIAGDGVFNTAKVKALDDIEKSLKVIKKPTPEQAEMVKSYLNIIEALRTAMATKKPTEKFAQYEPPPPPETEDRRRRNFDVSTALMEWKEKSKDRGFATALKNNVFKQAAYQIKDGVATIHFIPWTEANGSASSAPYALRGYVELTIPGEATAANMERAAALLKEAGVEMSAVTPSFKELLYLRKNLEILSPEFTPKKDAAWREIADDPSRVDSTKVDVLKNWARKNIKGAVLDGPEYNPDGIANSFGEGWRHWYRWDLPRSRVESEMKDYALHHNLSGALEDVVESILSGGGQFTPTTERLRTGVSISSGMSPQADLQTGGANYIFTRIAQKTKSYAGFYFKIGNLARADAFSFSTDRYGDVRPTSEGGRSDPRKARGKSIADFKKNSLATGNETIFKWGFNLLDEIDFIRTNNPGQRVKLIEIFRKNGYEKLPDGRAIEEVIK